MWLVQVTFRLAGRSFNDNPDLNQVEFVAASVNSLTSSEVDALGTPLKDQSDTELVPCPCESTVDSIRLLWRKVTDGCVGFNPVQCSDGASPSTSNSESQIYARVTCLTNASCTTFSPACGNVSTDWVFVAPMIGGAADLAPNNATLLTDATSLWLLASTTGNEFSSGTRRQFVEFRAGGNPVTAVLDVKNNTHALAKFTTLSPNNEGILEALIILEGDTGNVTSANYSQVATLVAAIPTLSVSTVELPSNTCVRQVIVVLWLFCWCCWCC